MSKVLNSFPCYLHCFLLLMMLSGQEQAPAEVKREAEEKKEEKAEEKKEEKVEEKKEDKPEEQKEEPKPPLPFVLLVDLHCMGCAKKIERALMKIRGLTLSLFLSNSLLVSRVFSFLSLPDSWLYFSSFLKEWRGL